MRFSHTLVLVTVGGLFAPPARADVTLHPLFGDNVVLQRGTQAPVYGVATPGEAVAVAVSAPDGPVIETKTTAAADGSWRVALPADLKPGTGYTLAVRGNNTVTLKNVAVGDVWVCSGQSNMGMSVNGSEGAAQAEAESKDAKLRLFTVGHKTSQVPLSDLKDLKHFGKWVEAGPDTVGSFSAAAYFFGESLRMRLPGDVPVGLIHTSWGGTPGEAWVSREGLDAVPELRHFHERLPAAIAAFDPAKADANFDAAMTKWKEAAAKAKADGKPEPRKPVKAIDPKVSQGSPSNLFHSMVHPLLGYKVRGVIWYQGEANGGRAAEYRALLPALIKDWRARWGVELPFFVVQLPGWKAGDANGVAWAELREAQYLASKALPKVGLAVTTDVGDPDDVHPKRKKPVGERLATAALAIEYGQPLEPIGPTYKAVTIEGDKAVVAFDHLGGGLECKGEKLTGFAVAGEDRKFHPADAEIKGDAVVVRSAAVPHPVAVRYGWSNHLDVNLWGKSGLPAVPFRTDDYPLTTAAKRK